MHGTTYNRKTTINAGEGREDHSLAGVQALLKKKGQQYTLLVACGGGREDHSLAGVQASPGEEATGEEATAVYAVGRAVSIVTRRVHRSAMWYISA